MNFLSPTCLWYKIWIVVEPRYDGKCWLTERHTIGITQFFLRFLYIYCYYDHNLKKYIWNQKWIVMGDCKTNVEQYNTNNIYPSGDIVEQKCQRPPFLKFRVQTLLYVIVQRLFSNFLFMRLMKEFHLLLPMLHYLGTVDYFIGTIQNRIAKKKFLVLFLMSRISIKPIFSD